jgi:hypothetical protein
VLHTVRVIDSHDAWLAGLDEPLRAEAVHCLLSGTYSRILLESLRRSGPRISARERGLDDPGKAQPGDPLGANLQTFLRERFAHELNSRLVSAGS